MNNLIPMIWILLFSLLTIGGMALNDGPLIQIDTGLEIFEDEVQDVRDEVSQTSGQLRTEMEELNRSTQARLQQVTDRTVTILESANATIALLHEKLEGADHAFQVVEEAGVGLKETSDGMQSSWTLTKWLNIFFVSFMLVAVIYGLRMLHTMLFILKGLARSMEGFKEIELEENRSFRKWLQSLQDRLGHFMGRS